MGKPQLLRVTAATRHETGKEAAKRLRRAGKFPAVMYGKGKAAVPLQVDERLFNAAAHSHGATHSVMMLLLDGSSKEHTVVVKNVQRHPLRRSVLHVDFQEVSMTEKIQATVPLALTNQAKGVKAGGVLQHGVYEVTIEGLPADIPEQIEVDVAEVDIGGQLRVADITAPQGLAIVSNPDEVVLTVLAPRLVEEEVAAAAEEEEVAAEKAPEAETP